MKTTKRVFGILIYLCIMVVSSASCSDNDEFAADKTPTEKMSTKMLSWHFLIKKI